MEIIQTTDLMMYSLSKDQSLMMEKFINRYSCWYDKEDQQSSANEEFRMTKTLGLSSRIVELSLPCQ